MNSHLCLSILPSLNLLAWEYDGLTLFKLEEHAHYNLVQPQQCYFPPVPISKKKKLGFFLKKNHILVSMTVIVIVNLGNTLLKRSNDLVESAHSILVRSASFVTLVDRNNGIVTELSSQFFVAKMRKRKKKSKFKKKRKLTL